MTPTTNQLTASYLGAVDDACEADRTIVHWISTETPDRENTIVLTAGIDLSEYNKNRIVLWSHDKKIPAVGKNLWIKRSKTKRGLIALTQFAPTPMGFDLWWLYSQGFLKGWSIGAVAQLPDIVQNKDETTTVKRCMLREYSACNLPMNVDTLDPASIDKAIDKLQTPELVEILRAYAPPSAEDAKPSQAQETPDEQPPRRIVAEQAEAPTRPVAELPPLDARRLPEFHARRPKEIGVAVLRSLDGKALARVAQAEAQEIIDRLKGRP